jgi:hypothetical protein
VFELELRIALDAANARLKHAVEALAPKHKGGEMAEHRAAHEAVLVAERRLAAALGEQYAVPLEFSAQWDSGAPLPYLLQNDYKTFLIFLLSDTQPCYDGSFVTVVSPGDANPGNMAIVEFKGCVCSKMGTPNDEVYEGHPLHGKGFEGYRPLRVVNSEFLALSALGTARAGNEADAWSYHGIHLGVKMTQDQIMHALYADKYTKNPNYDPWNNSKGCATKPDQQICKEADFYKYGLRSLEWEQGLLHSPVAEVSAAP